MIKASAVNRVVFWNEETALLERFKFHQAICPANSLSPRARTRLVVCDSVAEGWGLGCCKAEKPELCTE